MTVAYLELQNLQREFAGGVRALDGIEVQLGQGEFLSLLGPSGCGKTTALRLVAGFDRPDEGRIVIDGKDITKVAPSKRDMGMVFQAYSLFPNMTASQNVEFGLKIRGRKKGDRSGRVAELLELVGSATPATAIRTSSPRHAAALPSRARCDRAPRVAARRAAVHSTRRCACNCARRSAAFSSSSITTPMSRTTRRKRAVSDHVAVMYQGRIEQIGPPAEMYSRPATPFVAEFIGTMNRLEATIADSSAGTVEHGGAMLTVDAARGRTKGERVLVLIRPETVELTPENGSGAANSLSGEVIAQTFLGPVTRLKIVGPGADLIADVSTAKAATLPIGMRVTAVLPATDARVLELTTGRALCCEEPDPAGQ